MQRFNFAGVEHVVNAHVNAAIQRRSLSAWVRGATPLVRFASTVRGLFQEDYGLFTSYNIMCIDLRFTLVNFKKKSL